MMTFIQDLNDDVIKCVFENLYYLELLKLSECCHLFNRNIDKFTIKTKFMNNIFMATNLKYVMMEEKSLDDLLYPSSFYNSWNIINCCNSSCCNNNNNNNNNNDNKALGVVYFYYPKDLTPLEPEPPDPYTINVNSFNYFNRIEECKNAKYIKRFMPYCYDCMNEYVDFQERDDFQEIPYGTVYGTLDN